MTTRTAMPAAPVQTARASLALDSLKKPAAGPEGLFQAICRDIAQQEDPAEEAQADLSPISDVPGIPIFVPTTMPVYMCTPEQASGQTVSLPPVPAANPMDTMAVALSASLPAMETPQAAGIEGDVFAAVQNALDLVQAEQPIRKGSTAAAVEFPAAIATEVAEAVVATPPADAVVATRPEAVATVAQVEATPVERTAPSAAAEIKAAAQDNVGAVSATVTTTSSGKSDTARDAKTKDRQFEAAPGIRNKTVGLSEHGRFYEPAAVTQPTGTPVEDGRVQGPLLVRQIVESMEYTATAETREMTIQLKPDVFGELKIKLELDDGLLRAQIVTDSHPTRVLLQAHLSKLQDALAEKGIVLQDIQIEYSAPNTDGRQPEQSGYDQDRRPSPRGMAYGQSQAPEPEAAPVRKRQSGRPTWAGGIDMLA